MSERIIVGPAAASYPSLDVPAKPMEGSTQDPKYGVTLVFYDPKAPECAETMKAIASAIRKVVVSKVGEEKATATLEKMKNPANTASWHYPIRVVTEDDENPKYPVGTLSFKASTGTKPQVASPYPDPANPKKPKLYTDAETRAEVYPGAIIRASVTFYWSDKGKKNGGVCAALNNVQKLREGTRLDSFKSAADDFDVAEPDVANLDELNDLL